MLRSESLFKKTDSGQKNQKEKGARPALPRCPSTSGNREQASPATQCQRHNAVQKTTMYLLTVVVEMELIRMRPERQKIELLFAFPLDPHFHQVVCEDVAGR